MLGDSAAHATTTSSGRGWLIFLAVYSFILAFITAIPQFYYVLFALHLVAIGPNTNPLGEVWYWYILSGDNSYRHFDPGNSGRCGRRRVSAWPTLFHDPPRLMAKQPLGLSGWPDHRSHDLVCYHRFLPG
jgi:hypothetical protein